MGSTETRDKIHDTINHMPLEKLDTALSFLEDLQRSSEDETVMRLSRGCVQKITNSIFGKRRGDYC